MSDDFNNDSMLELYLFESTTLLDNLDAILLRAETARNLPAENINEIFRIMHTIKGSSAMMDFRVIADVAHKTEDLFVIVRDGGLNDARFDEIFDLLLRVSEFLVGEVTKIQEGEQPAQENSVLTDEIEKLTAKFKADAPEAPPAPIPGKMLGGAPKPLSAPTAPRKPEPSPNIRQPEPQANPLEPKPQANPIEPKPSAHPIEPEPPVHPIEPEPPARVPAETVYADMPVAPEGGRILGIEPGDTPRHSGSGQSAPASTVNRTIVGEPPRAPNSLATYNIHIHFNEGARMENIRAYMLVNKFGEMGTVNRTIPDNLENDAGASDYIIENGFYLSFTTGMFREQIETLAKGTLSVESVTFMRRMPDEAGGGAPSISKPADAGHNGDVRGGNAPSLPAQSSGSERTATGAVASTFPPRGDIRATIAQAIASSAAPARSPARANRIVSAEINPAASDRRFPAATEAAELSAAQAKPNPPAVSETNAARVGPERPPQAPTGQTPPDAPTETKAPGGTSSATGNAGVVAPVSGAAGTQGKPLKQNIISVDLTKLDSLLDLVGEIVINESMVTENTDLERLKLEGLKLENFNKAARHLNKLTNELQDTVMSVRMVPVAMTFQRMRRIVRDMGKRLHKDAELVLMGENTEVDKTILDALGDPIMHLVRNAMDHAIETKEERMAAGKSPSGHIVLSARNMGGDIIISVSDDGRGLDAQTILTAAAQKNLLKKPESEYSEKEIFNLLMTPGFSTRENVTEFSGRGVGMDVVKSNIEKIGGTIIIESVKGVGTNILLKIPLTLAIIDCMQIKLGDSIFSVPITSIRESFKSSAGQTVCDPMGNEMIMLRGSAYSIIRLHEAFGVENAVKDIDDGILILTDTGDKLGCLFADELIGKYQIVVKTMPAYLNRFNIKAAGISGCTIMGNGEISLIIDAQELLA
ncbi:MAG: chemotaxis protein CheW [Clostridiales Family XIII bacterium]|jgi:chemotaxis protein histidine kinase CheA|nr:chemotaxis protein CheW [Clostridiales Family XIII bacterium]